MINKQYFEIFKDSFGLLTDAFTETHPQWLIPSTNSDTVKSLLKNIEEGVKQNLIIYGQKGLGRKSSVQKGILDSRKDFLCVTVSAYVMIITKQLHSTEGSMIAAIENQLRAFTKTNMHLDNLDTYFSQFQDRNGIVLIIDDIDALAQKRQVFLYSLLEWVKQTKLPVLFVGITSCLTFIDTLEKRVRSRYQHLQLFHFENSVDHIRKIILNRIEHFPKEIKKQYQMTIKSEPFKALMNTLATQSFSISEYLYMFRLSFANIMVEIQTKPEYDIMDSIRQAVQLISPNFKLQMLKSNLLQQIALNYPEYSILFSVYNLLISQKPQILFNDVLNHIKQKTQEFTTKNAGQATAFSAQIYHRALDNLFKLNLMKFEDKNSKNLDTNEILLNVPIEDMKLYFESLDQVEFPETIMYLAFAV